MKLLNKNLDHLFNKVNMQVPIPDTTRVKRSDTRTKRFISGVTLILMK